MNGLCTNITRILGCVILGSSLLNAADLGPVELSFAENGQTIEEATKSVSVVVELTEASLLDVSFSYAVHSSTTAIQGEDEDDEDCDFYIAEDTVKDGEITYDNGSPITIEPGETEATITISLLNDDIQEGTEYIVLELIGDDNGVAKLGDSTIYTLKILDNDRVTVYFNEHEYEFMENKNVAVPVRLSTNTESDVEVLYNVELVTLDENDIDLTSDYTSDNPLEISSGSTSGTIVLDGLNDSVTDRNEGGANEETLRITLVSAELVDTGEALEVDTEPVIVTVIDNDPLLLEFSYDEDDEQPFEIKEHQGGTSIGVQFIWAENPDAEEDGDLLSSGSDSIFIPISFGGSATMGEDEDDESGDYYIDDDDFEDGLLEVSAGNTSDSFLIYIVNDDLVEEDETITITLGTPYYEDGGDIILGEKREVILKIVDNDPIDLSFGAYYSLDDELASEDEDYEDIVFIPASSSDAAESWQTVSIPIYLSSTCAHDITFDLEVVGDGTTATLYDSDWDEDEDGEQDWDYSIFTPVTIEEPDDPQEVTILAGGSYASITVTINNDDETPVIYGQSASDDVESDETIKFRISNMVVEDEDGDEVEGVISFGESTEYTLTIKELPDIDITALVEGLSPVSADFVNGQPAFNSLTGLFEVHYDMRLNTELVAQNFPGYRSIKAQFKPTNFDASDLESDGNDELYQYPEEDDLEDGEEFNYTVNTPFQLRYPSATETITLREGADPVDDYYDESTADIYELAPYILKPIQFPVLNSEYTTEIEGAFDINDELDWWVDFYSRGYDTFDVSRIDPALGGAHRLRVYLTAEGTDVYAGSASGLSVEQFVPQPDGSMYIVVPAPSSGSVQVQYLDAGDVWKLAQPASISTGGGSKFYWIDKGPPQTHVHPSEVPFRLYRITSN